jgi:pimeloyl-ACP methyl ester carboxylesterase
MKTLFAGLVMTAAVAIVAGAFAHTSMKMDKASKPVVVLVHGAFADASSWSGVIEILRRDGYHVIAAANPLRGVKNDGRYVSSLVGELKSPVVLVGHSYGGSVITEAANGHANVKALVYVSAFAPDTGESASDLAGRFPGSTLGQALAPPIPLPGGSKDLYILQQKFHAQFAADVPDAQGALMAATQRPVTDAALNEKTGEAAWKTIPSWYVYGTADRNIPPAAMAFMAARAHAKDVVAVKGASHVVMVSHPEVVARLIEKAAAAD